MQRHSIKKIVFWVMMGIYLLVPFYMIFAYATVLNEGNLYRFRPAPVDPYDAFRGKYITLSFQERALTYDTTGYRFDRGENIYLLLEKDSSGFALISKALKNIPEGKDYIKTTVQYEWIDSTGHISYQLPFNRYYLPEEMAQRAEDVYRENLSWNTEQRDSVYVDVRIKDGKAVIEELYFNEVPVKEYIHRIEEVK